MHDVHYSTKALCVTPGVYVHFRGNRYRVLGVGFNEVTSEEYVVYQALYGDEIIWLRPIDNFLEKIETGEGLVARFRKIDAI